jgi:predicted Zn-ribbon and HTH transcriptional regulator
MEIQDIFDVGRSVALADLRHLQLSLRHERENLLMVPPACEACGYTFRMDEPRAPGRCPICRSERVLDPVFKVANAEA